MILGNIRIPLTFIPFTPDRQWTKFITWEIYLFLFVEL